MASVAVPPGATSTVVTGSFLVPYQLALSANWATTLTPSARAANGFTVSFTVPAPPGATLDYFVLGPGGAQPSGAGILFSNTVPVGPNAFFLVITGVFTLPYQVTITPSWPTEAPVTDKTATQFRIDFTVPAPTPAQLDYVLFVPAIAPGPTPGVPGTLAGELITNIRDEIPDPVYDAAGNPLPDQNGGLVRASTLYGWLDDGVRYLARLTGAIISDWTAIAQTGVQPWYAVDPRFQTIVDGFSNQWRLNMVSITEGDVIWPNTAFAISQSLWGYLHKVSDHLEVGLWPVPALTDPTALLQTALPPTGAATIVLDTTANFLSFGYVRIDGEIIQYQQLTTPTGPIGLAVLSRGQCGSSPAAHAVGSVVQSLGLWLKGTRSPARIVNSLSVVELPLDVVTVVKTYVLARVRGMENEFEERSRLMKLFNDECAQIRADPYRKESVGQITAYGDPKLGPLAWQGQVIRP